MDSWSFYCVRSRRKLAWVSIPTVVSWTIRKEWNSRIFEELSSDVSDLVQKANWTLCT